MMFSIICLTYKRRGLLEEALFSVLQQTHKDFELLIINDNDKQKFYFEHPQVRIFNLDSKFKTLGDKRNFGVANAVGDLIIQLDDDDFLLPDYLENLKTVMGDADFLYPQKPIMYFNDHSKIFLSPEPLTNTFLYKRESIGKHYHYDSINFDELTPFYLRVKESKKTMFRMSLLRPEQCGYVYRQDIDQNRKYSMGSFKTENISEQNGILYNVNDIVGDIELVPRWSEDYVSIIKTNCKFPKSQKTFKIDEAIKKQEKEWKSIRISWENAVKFVESVNSRGILSTASDYLNISNDCGEKVSEEIYALRKESCFGNIEKNISPCEKLRVVKDKGSFCSSCGCGSNKLAQLDGTGYTKLHYPYLECPLKRKGFSNFGTNEYIKPVHEPPLSIIIPVLNDVYELNQTIRSIRETSPNNVEIIVIDDYSDIPVIVEDKQVKIIRLEQRRGVGASRFLGAQKATSEFLLFIDSHMRFDDSWYNNALRRMINNPSHVVWCATCLGLEEGVMDLKHNKGSYHGAKLVLYESSENQVFEGKWIAEKPEEDYEISCLMGACYFFHKSWFFHIRGTESLKMWGSDEPLLSVKTWLAGGSIRIIKDVKIGHKFRPVSPYKTDSSYIVYNKLRSLYILFSDEIYSTLEQKIPNDAVKSSALVMFENDREIIEKERLHYRSIFTKDPEWFFKKFNITL